MMLNNGSLDSDGDNVRSFKLQHLHGNSELLQWLIAIK